MTYSVLTKKEREAHHNKSMDEGGGESAVTAEPRHSPSRHAESVMPFWTTALAMGDNAIDEGRGY